MGCFLSTNSAAPPPPSKTDHRTPYNSAASTQYNAGSKSPPPVDEETVKQVLSETPAIPKRRPPPVPRFHVSDKLLHQNGGAAKKPTAAFSRDDPSDVDSEIRCSHSESFSTGGDGGLRWPRLNSRQFDGEMKREKTEGRSPARRSDKSPSRVKPGSGYSRKTGGGDSLGRRSRSPAIRSGSGSSKTGIDGGKSSSKMGKHPGHVGFGSVGVEEPPTSNELLESSLVSLECFIFL